MALEFALGAASFFYSHIILGSEIGSGLVFATSVVLCHYLALAVVTIAWRISPFHPLYKFPGYVVYAFDTSWHILNVAVTAPL